MPERRKGLIKVASKEISRTHLAHAEKAGEWPPKTARQCLDKTDRSNKLLSHPTNKVN